MGTKQNTAKLLADSPFKGNEKSIEKRVNVEPIENGFLITVTKEGKNAKGEWQYVTKKYYSETDPLEFNEDGCLADKLD